MTKETLDFVAPLSAEKLQNFFGVFLQFQIGVDTGRAGSQSFALAHNGVLCNDVALRRAQHLPATKIETDSYVAVQFLEKSGGLCPDALARMAEALDGTYTITVLDAANTMYFVRGNNPLTIRYLPRLGCYLYASTDEILDMALEELELLRLRQITVPISQGDIMTIDEPGKRTVTRFNDARLWTPRYFCDWGWHDRTAEYHNYLETVLEFGKRQGVPERELRMLVDAGYDALDLEELIHDNQFRENCVQEIMADFGVY